MGKIIIKCGHCGRDWSEETKQLGYGICECGKTYCAKWRNWEWVEDEKQ